MIHFFSKSSPRTKNRLIVIMLNVKYHDVKTMNWLNALFSPFLSKKIMLSVWYYIKATYFYFFGFYLILSWSTIECTLINWTNWVIYSHLYKGNWSIPRLLYVSTITPTMFLKYASFQYYFFWSLRNSLNSNVLYVLHDRIISINICQQRFLIFMSINHTTFWMIVKGIKPHY